MSKIQLAFISALILCFGCTAQSRTSDSDVNPPGVEIKKGELVSSELDVSIMRRKAIWEAMGESQYPEVRPLLTLEQFYLHSRGEADLWYNIHPYPKGIDQYEFHSAIRAREDVWDVLISITQLDSVPALDVDKYDKEGWFEWPNSDHTLLITTADEKTIRSWFPKSVQPDEIHIGNSKNGTWTSPEFIPKGFHKAWLWYD